MKYFTGAGAGKGWNKFKFILHPAEFFEVFSKSQLSFVVTNTRVAIGYEYTSKETLFSAYERYYEKVASGDNWNKKKDWKIDNAVRASIIDDLRKVSFIPIKTKKEAEDGKYQLVQTEEPVINLSPFSLYLGAGKLSIESFYEQGNIGIELSYPKVISMESDGHSTFHSTSDYAVKKVYDDLIVDIKLKSKKAVIKGEAKTYKPNFWVSKKCHSTINENHFLKFNNLTIK